jgi:hypothetical protein
MSFSIFSGGVVISCGGGAIFSPLFDIANPIFAGDGREVINSSQNASQGQTLSGATHILVDNQGHRKDISRLIRFYASLIYSFITLILSYSFILMRIYLGKIPIDPVYYTINPPGYRRHDGPIIRTVVTNAWIAVSITALVISMGLIKGIVYFAASLKSIM